MILTTGTTGLTMSEPGGRPACCLGRQPRRSGTGGRGYPTLMRPFVATPTIPSIPNCGMCCSGRSAGGERVAATFPTWRGFLILRSRMFREDHTPLSDRRECATLPENIIVCRLGGHLWGRENDAARLPQYLYGQRFVLPDRHFDGCGNESLRNVGIGVAMRLLAESWNLAWLRDADKLGNRLVVQICVRKHPL